MAIRNSDALFAFGSIARRLSAAVTEIEEATEAARAEIEEAGSKAAAVLPHVDAAMQRFHDRIQSNSDAFAEMLDNIGRLARAVGELSARVEKLEAGGKGGDAV